MESETNPDLQWCQAHSSNVAGRGPLGSDQLPMPISIAGSTKIEEM